jgi:glycosyltransferase involved in cell wall biosynthesis
MLVDSFPSWSKKIRIIPHGVDPNQFKTSKNKSGNNILFVGRIHPTKGIHTLLKACLEINKTIELNIAGPIADDNYFSQLRALLTDKSDKLKVNFLGKVSRQELLLAYSEADIFVLPSSSETFPIVLLEAMASALPIVATNVGGIPEVLTNNYNGFVVNPNDSFNLSKKLKQLLNDANLRNLMGERNRKLLLTKFDLRKNYAMIEALYKELVD